MNAEYLFNCVGCSPSELEIIEKFEAKSRKNANKNQKKLIIESGYFDSFSLFKDWSVEVKQFKYQNKLFICVLHSRIHNFFQIN